MQEGDELCGGGYSRGKAGVSFAVEDVVREGLTAGREDQFLLDDLCDITLSVDYRVKRYPAYHLSPQGHRKKDTVPSASDQYHMNIAAREWHTPKETNPQAPPYQLPVPQLYGRHPINLPVQLLERGDDPHQARGKGKRPRRDGRRLQHDVFLRCEWSLGGREEWYMGEEAWAREGEECVAEEGGLEGHHGDPAGL